MSKQTCTMQNAEKFWKWIKERGGVAVWRSINLSNPGASWSSPALTDGKPTTKPTWQVANEPECVITNSDDIEVSFDKEVKRFHVAVRMSSNGLSLKVTDGGTRRIRAEEVKAGEGAYHVFDYDDYKNAVIMAPEKTMSLSAYAKEKGWS